MRFNSEPKFIYIFQNLKRLFLDIAGCKNKLPVLQHNIILITILTEKLYLSSNAILIFLISTHITTTIIEKQRF